MNDTPRTAYILQVHKNPNQINTFIQQLISDKLADVFVHFDKKNIEQLVGHIQASEHVRILPRSIDCEWGDISQVDTTILLLKEVLASKNKYDFVCFRSGQDLLVKNGFKDFLMANQTKIFMKLRDVKKNNLGLIGTKWPKIARKRYTSVHPIRVYRRIVLSLYSRGIKISPNTNQLPKGYSLYTGSQWFCIPLDVARYIIDFLEKNQWYYHFFQNTMCPDEWFFQTLIMNSPYKKNVVNNNLLFLKWGKTLSERNSPQDLTTADIDLIDRSGCFFARKFDETIDHEVIQHFANRVKFNTFTREEEEKKVFNSIK